MNWDRASATEERSMADGSGSQKRNKSGVSKQGAFVKGPLYGTSYHYKIGMELAIEAIVEKWKSMPRGIPEDFLVYPVGFLCRHLIELQLKELTRDLIASGDLPKQLKRFA